MRKSPNAVASALDKSYKAMTSGVNSYWIQSLCFLCACPALGDPRKTLSHYTVNCKLKIYKSLQLLSVDNNITKSSITILHIEFVEVQLK